jgi:CRP/FNR family transcriptional regulator, cyclic AMP receptor protein
MTTLEQFTGTAGQKRLAKALKSHEIIGKNAAMARDFAKQATIEEFTDGQTLLEQHGTDTHLYMILDGEVAIEVNGNRVATSGPGVPIGEMALVDPEGGRSASVVAVRDTVVARIARPKFLTLAKKYPQIWHAIARHLARHVRRHNARFK